MPKTTKRADPNDGQLYSKHEFLMYYGKTVGSMVWDSIARSQLALTAGMRVQAWAEGKWWQAEVLSTDEKRALAPIKVHWVGYSNVHDAWVSVAQVRSKALKADKDAQKKDAKEETKCNPLDRRLSTAAILMQSPAQEPAQGKRRLSCFIQSVHDMPQTRLVHEDPHAYKRMLLVSDQMPFFEVLIRASNMETLVVPVQYLAWNLDDLALNIAMRAGKPDQQFESIGLLDHGDDDELCLVRAASVEHAIKLADLSTSQGHNIMVLFRWLATYLKPPKELGQGREDPVSRFDLLCCSGEHSLDFLEEATKVNWNMKCSSSSEDDKRTMSQFEKVADLYFDVPMLTRWKSFEVEAFAAQRRLSHHIVERSLIG